MESTQSGPNVLLVEDDKYIALALKIRLQAAGFNVRIANTVSKAMEEAASEAPDIALLDYNLPDGNGIELMRTLLQSEATAEVRAIIMTASKQGGLKEEAMMQGAFDYFEKPFESSQLVESVHTAARTCVH